MTTYKQTENYDLSDENSDEYDNALDDLADRINSLNDRLTTSNIENMISESRQKLDRWRSDCYNLIDRFYENKCREFDRHVAEIIDKQRKEINRIRSNTATLIHKHDILSKDIDYITTITGQLEQDLDETKEKYFQINIHSLEINENLIEIKKTNDICNSSVISPPYKTMNYLDDSSKILCTNERHLLLHHNSNLCLLDKDLNIIREKSWTQGYIMDICWSLTLVRFIVLTRNYLYLIDESTMSIMRIQKIPKLSWWSCTCSDTYLYVATKDWGSNIYQFTLWPSIQLSKRWQSPQTCKQNETINDIIYNKEKLALLIYNRLTKNKMIELRISTTLDCLWSLDLDIDYDSRAIRCCLLSNDEWLIIDWNTSNLYHISNDGKLKSTCDYNPSPSCATMFGTNMLVMSTIDGVNLHKL
ncbi:unnamed protein product [Rotaria sp. Silwood2]|nr:unnamed protein product [Rotaria sp. Silwood2]CAF2702386.1 unnamed protein product [Rotaria sp. Silwood2]CAF2952021.1 unnamed protein product [Rotaria sp. Silwood2]CAF3108239.1 unnamed protein product [Rotaria sp. Silwood2]CAF4020977.1 unnamed protein product [Rotaria sp. Silwood2]